MSLLDDKPVQHSCCSGLARFGLKVQSSSLREQLSAQAGELQSLKVMRQQYVQMDGATMISARPCKEVHYMCLSVTSDMFLTESLGTSSEYAVCYDCSAS